MVGVHARYPYTPRTINRTTTWRLLILHRCIWRTVSKVKGEGYRKIHRLGHVYCGLSYQEQGSGVKYRVTLRALLPIRTSWMPMGLRDNFQHPDRQGRVKLLLLVLMNGCGLLFNRVTNGMIGVPRSVLATQLLTSCRKQAFFYLSWSLVNILILCEFHFTVRTMNTDNSGD